MVLHMGQSYLFGYFLLVSLLGAIVQQKTYILKLHQMNISSNIAAI